MRGKLQKETEKGIQYQLILGEKKKINITRPAYDVRVFRSHNTEPFSQRGDILQQGLDAGNHLFLLSGSPTPSHARGRTHSA